MNFIIIGILENLNNTAEDYVVMYYKVGKEEKWNDTNNTALGAADHYCIEYHDHTDTLSTSSYATASITLTSSTSLDSSSKAIIRSQTINTQLFNKTTNKQYSR